jgi:hypothetical protein
LSNGTITTTPVPSALQLPWTQKATILPATSPGGIIIARAGFYTQQTTPSKVFSIIVTNNDTINHDILISINDPTGYYAIGTINVPADAGRLNNVPAVNMLQKFSHLPVDNSGQPYIFLSPADQLAVSTYQPVSSGPFFISFLTMGADF